MQTPVVFLVFNRPELTARVFEQIRAARPPKLLVVCDGARPTRPDDASKVEAVHQIIETGVDWPCEVLRNYAEQNLGCRKRIASGLDWAFSEVEQAIILEDDCLPDPSFFPYCEELLNRYRHDERVLHIGGSNLAAPHMGARTGYWFSRHASVWGWASWRRAWKHYDFTMSTWAERERTFLRTFASNWEKQYWLATMDHARRNLEQTNSWAFSWSYTCRSLDAFTILPTKNLIENLGFGGDATHTLNDAAHMRRPTEPIGMLRHPQRIVGDPFKDELLTRAYASEPISFLSNLKSRLRILRYRRQKP